MRTLPQRNIVVSIGSRFAATVWASLILAATPGFASPIKLERPPVSGVALVTDAGAPGGPCTAVNIQEQHGTVTLPFQWPDAAPGLYRVALPLRLYAPAELNAGSLQLRIEFGDTNAVWLADPVAPAKLDAAPNAWTVLTHSVILSEPLRTNQLTVTWAFVVKKPPTKVKRAAGSKTPVPAPKVKEPTAPPAPSNPDDVNQPRSLEQLDDPAILVGAPVLEPVTTTLAVEKVWPEYVHVYPGGTNPVLVTVRNFTSAAADATVRLEMQTALDEAAPAGEVRIQIPAHGTAPAQFPWVAGAREYGHAAVATVSVGGHPVHSKTEYFSVSTPIWKTAIQGSGFISWYGREAQFAQHVENNRRSYINVEEAFSWQPSSWTDLNPTTEDWWSGQGNGHNSLKGLREWVARSHSNGIKMITYSWPTVSGKAGFDWTQRHPDILCRDATGVAAQVGLADLHWWGLTHDRPEFWKYQSGTWLRNFVNLGLLRAIDHHAQEVIRSARNFGWDGLRFDMPPAWSEMGTNDVQRELDMLGVRDVIRQLLPEACQTKSNVWTGAEISARNVRYFRYLFKKELGEHFALSYNAGGREPVPDEKIPWLREMSQGGGQLMNEAIRYSGTISNYLAQAEWHTAAVRQAGGYSCLFSIGSTPLAAIYSAIFTFASGSHPYLDYGWSTMPGRYTQFMTRYGEYCWDLALVPLPPDKAGITVESTTPLLWEPYLRSRKINGVLQTVVHLITKPELDHKLSLQQSQVEWPRNIVVKKVGTAEPTVWLLTAEPEVAAVRLPVHRSGTSYSVTVPTLHYWSMLVWSEKS